MSLSYGVAFQLSFFENLSCVTLSIVFRHIFYHHEIAKLLFMYYLTPGFPDPAMIHELQSTPPVR